jgi:hypothetical protein
VIVYPMVEFPGEHALSAGLASTPHVLSREMAAGVVKPAAVGLLEGVNAIVP